KTDAITQNLWVWCERLEKWGKILFWALIIIGIINTITSAIDSHQFLKQIGADTIEEIRKESAKLGMEIPTVFETLVHNLLLWTFYAILEYCSYHVLALLVGSLASIVQHNKIFANISLYRAAKDESVDDEEKECSDAEHDNDKKLETLLKLKEKGLISEEDYEKYNDDFKQKSLSINTSSIHGISEKELENKKAEEKRENNERIIAISILIIVIAAVILLYVINAGG
ncbi:MAG: hypothetical protein J5662_01000, partial [Clostridia bacterium]|nr:hypothetical protein [Clostridia bacterium]